MLKQFLTHCIIYVICIVAADVNVDRLIDIEASCASIKHDEIENHLSTKTPYRVVANTDDTPVEYPGCKPTRMWSVVRHGARNPSKKVIEQARRDLMNLKNKILNNPNAKLCSNEVSRLKFWYFNVTVDEAKHLVAEGEDELIELAERMQNRFPSLLPDSYHPNYYYFKYTATQRTLESAKSFATGLFGRHRLGEIVYPEALHKDPVLRVSMKRITSGSL